MIRLAKRWSEPLIGLCLILALLGVFILALREPVPRDISVVVEGPRAHLLFEKSPDDVLALGPRELVGRVKAVEPEGLSATELLTYRIVYGHRWEREITVPRLVGKMSPEGEPWPCAIKLRLNPEFFDDRKPGGGDVAEMLDAQIRAQFPRSIVVAGRKLLEFKEVKSSEILVSLDEGKIQIFGTVALDDDDSKPTEFRFKGVVLLEASGGDLSVRLDDFDLRWTGKTRQKLLVELVDIVTDVEKIAEGEVRKEIAKVLPFIKIPKAPVALEDLVIGGPTVGIRGSMYLRVCKTPEISKEGIVFDVGATVELDGRPKDPIITGPVSLPNPGPKLAFEPKRDDGSPPYNIEAIASAEALQQTLYVLWQSRALERWGQDDEVLDAFRAAMADRLTLKVEGVDVQLPPTFVSQPANCDGAIAVRFADVVLGHLDDGRRAIAHADVCGAPRVRGGRLELEGHIVYVAANCAAFKKGNVELTPCLSDVIPVVRAEAMDKYTLPISLPIPERLLSISLVQNASLKIDDLRADTRGSVLRIKARGSLSGSL